MIDEVSRITLESLHVGTAAPWYRHENLPAIDDAIDAGELPRDTGYFVEIGMYNVMADYRSNSWEGQIVDGPFATRADAEAAIDEISY